MPTGSEYRTMLRQRTEEAVRVAREKDRAAAREVQKNDSGADSGTGKHRKK